MGGLPQCMLGYHLPRSTPEHTPWSRPPKPIRNRPPLGADPPKHTHPSPGAHPPGHTSLEHTPPEQTPPTLTFSPPPPGKQTPAYGQRAAGTHPTGVHSCYKLCYERCEHHGIVHIIIQ